MTKFGSAFMMKSPFKKHGDQYREKAKELSKESGTPGDFDRDNPEVVKELEKADKADSEHEDSPLQGAYTSGADGIVYVSNRDAFKQLQDDIVSTATTSIKAERDSKKYKDYENLPDDKFTAKYGMNKEDYIAAINKANKQKE